MAHIIHCAQVGVGHLGVAGAILAKSPQIEDFRSGCPKRDQHPGFIEVVHDQDEVGLIN